MPCIPPPVHRPGGTESSPGLPPQRDRNNAGLSSERDRVIVEVWEVPGGTGTGCGRRGPLAGQGLKISATAETETPSSRPSKPRCSVVVALTDTRSVSIPIAPAIAARMAAM